jgi:hypothetical protein
MDRLECEALSECLHRLSTRVRVMASGHCLLLVSLPVVAAGAADASQNFVLSSCMMKPFDNV